MEEPWMMFTRYQVQELIEKTIYSWTSINGVNGYKFNSMFNNSKYIFLPAGGHCVDKSNDIAGSYGLYWSSMWSYSSSYALHLRFTSSSMQSTYTSRSYGQSIRAVRPLEW